MLKAAGEMSGTQVVVYTYPSRDDQRFVDALKSAKQIWYVSRLTWQAGLCISHYRAHSHPYVLTVLGYSRPGSPGEAAYIVTEGTPADLAHAPFSASKQLVNRLSSVHGIYRCLAWNRQVASVPEDGAHSRHPSYFYHVDGLHIEGGDMCTSMLIELLISGRSQMLNVSLPDGC